MGMAVHEIINIRGSLCRNAADKEVVSGSQKKFLRVFAKGLPVLHGVDDNAGIQQCSHILFSLSSRASSSVISSGKMPNRDFATATRS